MTETDSDGTAVAEPDGYQPKPPLWQPASRPRRMPRSEILLLVLAFAIVAPLVVVFAEAQFLATPATETALTITGLESTDPADEHHAAKFHYRVRLPDGSSARFASSDVYPPGTRLRAMVSRGLLTRRVLVTPPYVAVQAE